MTIVEQLFLLLTRADDKVESVSGQNELALRAAVLNDLLLAGRVRFSPSETPEVVVADASPVGHPALDQALARIIQTRGVCKLWPVWSATPRFSRRSGRWTCWPRRA